MGVDEMSTIDQNSFFFLFCFLQIKCKVHSRDCAEEQVLVHPGKCAVPRPLLCYYIGLAECRVSVLGQL